MSNQDDDVRELFRQYRKYVEELRAAFLDQNRVRSNEVYEVMSPEDRAEVHNCIDRWDKYITPLSETWWGERGFDVVWPEDNSQPMGVRRKS